MQFDRQTLKTIRADLDAALAPVAKKHGITLSLGAISFRPERFTTRLTAEGGKAAGLDPDVKARKEFEEFAGAFFFKTDDFGRSFTTAAGKAYTIVGVKPRSRQYPILGKNAHTGTVYKFSAAEVLEGLGRTAEAKRARLGLDYRSAERLGFQNRYED